MKRSLLLLLVLLSCKGSEHKTPNVLLLTLDTLRADHVGAYGAKSGATPNIDALAARGVRFEHAMTAAPLTLPSHATILSGVLPPHHGLRNNGAGVFPADRTTLATLFSQNGYRTGAFIGAFVLDRKFGLNRGFDVYDDEIPRDPAGDHLEAERRGDAVVDRALQWLGSQDARPSFAWVHLYDAHFPYVAPEPFRARYPSSAYDAEIAFVDEQVRRLLQTVDENTIVVIAGDHGEALGEHGELTHGLLLYEPTLRVPLVLAAPGVATNVVQTPVSLADVAPTIATLANLQLTGALDGHDLAPSLRDRKEPPAADLYAETEYPALYGWSPLAAMRRGMHKYISSPHPELFDLAKDPHETRNVLSDERRVMRALDAQLKTIRASAPAQPTAAPDAETLAKLASLGYVGGAVSPRTGADRPDPKLMAPLFHKFEEAMWATTAKKLDDAATLLDEIVRADPQNPVFRGSLAKVERQRGRHQRAIELYREAIAYAPDDPQAWYNLASAFEEAGDLAHAGEAAREALKHDSRSADAHNVLGIVHLAEGQPVRALEEFQNAIAIDPRSARAYNNVGNVARAMKRFNEAEAAFRKSSELAPEYPDPLNGLGALDIDRDRYGEAIAWFDRALKLAPDFHEARLNRAVALQLSGDVSGAIAEYRRFLEQSANHPGFAQQREAARSMLKRLEAAR